MDESGLGFAVAAAAAVVGGVVIWAATRTGKKEVSCHRGTHGSVVMRDTAGSGTWRDAGSAQVCVCALLCVLTRNYWQAFLDKTRQKVTLSEKIQLSHDTYIYRFALPKKNMMLGLPVGKHFKVRI
jgi:hypothetical protein